MQSDCTLRIQLGSQAELFKTLDMKLVDHERSFQFRMGDMYGNVKWD